MWRGIKNIRDIGIRIFEEDVQVSMAINRQLN